MKAPRRGDLISEAFLGVLSHEIRTPMTTIRAGVRIVASDAYSAADRLAVADDVVAEAERLRSLVEDLLALGRLDRRTLVSERQPVSISHVVATAIELADVPGQHTEIALRGPRDVVAASADPDLVAHVVRNLLDNAIRYGREGAPVDVVLEASIEEIRVRFLDRGTDPVTDGTGAFELDTQPPAARAQRAGAGIGLYVAARLVRSMGGRVWANSRPGGGSEFGFALPHA